MAFETSECFPLIPWSSQLVCKITGNKYVFESEGFGQASEAYLEELYKVTLVTL